MRNSSTQNSSTAKQSEHVNEAMHTPVISMPKAKLTCSLSNAKCEAEM
jgi:hypothetical protein